MNPEQRNWAGNLTYGAASLHYPETVEQVQALVRSGSRLKVLGSRHSFNTIADTTGDLISLEHFDPAIVLDREHRTVTVAAGIKYGHLSQQLHREGYAVHNLASLPHISVAGACATATHGSGDGNGNLATAVAAMELVTGDGEIVELSREQHGDQFHGVVVGLGGLGVVTRLTLDVVPAFDMRQDVYDTLSQAQLEENFDAIVSSVYSVSLFTNWRDGKINQVWLKRRVGDDTPDEVEAEYFGAQRVATRRHPIKEVPAENTTDQQGIRGPSHERLPHFRMEFTPSSGEELQSEYYVPRRHAVAAYRAIAGIGEQIAPLLQVSELRTIAADDLWMSPCYKQACVGLHFTWYKDWPAVSKVLPLIEEQLAPFDARPHWGKMFTMQPERVRSLYERLPDFQKLLQSYDPQGKFRNAFLDRYIFGA